MRTWVELSREAWKANWRSLRQCIDTQKTTPIAMIKANAYGHGLLQVAQLAREDGVAIFGIDSIQEALILRKAGFTEQLYLFGYIPQDELPLLKTMEHTVVSCFSFDQVQHIQKVHPTQRIQLPIETGLTREGIDIDSLPEVLTYIREHEMSLESIYTHFANIEDVTKQEFAQRQIERYQQALDIINEHKFDSVKKHTSASGAALLFPSFWFDAVRIGIAQYGLWPSDAIQNDISVTLLPVLSWKTRIAQVKHVKAYTAISYGLTESLPYDAIIAVLPIGYYDGFDRVGASSKAEVLIQGQPCRVIGRVCMNMCMVDCTNLKELPKTDEEVVIIGSQGDAYMGANALAQQSETIHYEIVTRIGEHIPRIIVPS